MAITGNLQLVKDGEGAFVVGLAGSGEIAGGEFDLTTADASRVSSPTTFAGGVAANLFNNNFTRSGADNTRRILVGEAYLPVVVDYDFGEATFVDTYALYVGPEWCHRTPKMWQIYGSNGGDDWTLLDERTSPDIANSALCRRFTIATPAAYRLYRFKTDAPLGRDSPEWENLEMVQLEYGDSRTFGELHVTVPEGGDGRLRVGQRNTCIVSRRCTRPDSVGAQFHYDGEPSDQGLRHVQDFDIEFP